MKKNIILKNDINELSLLTEILREIQTKLKFSDDIFFDINLALDELITNIIIHSYKNLSLDTIIEITVESIDDTLQISIADVGNEFNPLSIPEPILTLDIEEKPIGGLGIFLVKKKIDKISYERKENKNILILIKKLT